MFIEDGSTKMAILRPNKTTWPKKPGMDNGIPPKKSPSQEKDTETTLSQLELAKVTREALPLDEEQK